MKIRMHWGLGVALVYGAFALATTSVAIFAMRSRVDLVSPDYYAHSLSHDKHLAAVSRARALETAGRFRMDTTDDGRTIDLRWVSAADRPREATMTLYRPSDSAADRVLLLERAASGHHRVSLSDLTAGRWILQVQWHVNGEDYYDERELMVR